MKQLLFLLMMITGACTFTSCDKSDDTVDPIKENLFNSKYIVNDAGCCVLDGLQPIRAEIINDEVKGYGWKVIGIYKIMDNGKLSQKDYRDMVYGSGYTDYWFKADNNLIGFQHSDVSGKNYINTEWSYDDSKGYIMRYSADLSISERYMQVLYVATLQGKEFYLYTIQKLGNTTIKNDITKPFYGLVIYQRMTDKELAEIKKEYKLQL